MKDILALFSKAGILVVEYREYGGFIDLILDRPVNTQLFNKLHGELLREHNILVYQLKSTQPIIRLVPYTHRTPGITKYKWILTITAIVTIFLTGYGLAENLHSVLSSVFETPINTLRVLIDALIYTIVFLTTLLSHELGHYFTSRKTGSDVEGPILIPAPPIQLGFLGTFGAIIFTKIPPKSKKELARLGISGPLAGFIVATLFGILGHYLSPIIPVEEAEKLISTGKVTPIRFGSLIFYLLSLLPLNQNEGVSLMHPVFFASYIMYLITFLNLLPIGQLDGGHVVRSITSNRVYLLISRVTVISMLILGTAMILAEITPFYLSIGFILLLFYFTIGRTGHPGVINQYDETSCSYCILAYLLLLILTLPIPYLFP